MSEIERIEGVIQLVPRFENETDKEYFERATGCNFQKYDYAPDSLHESISDNDLYEKYVAIGDKLYKFLEYKQEDPYDNYCNLQKIDEGKIKFFSSFYNGCTCLSEMLEYTLQEIAKGE